jgi:hypothetical protein
VGYRLSSTREEGAKFIVREFGYLIRQDEHDNWYVPSRSDPEVEYCLPPAADVCPCPDHQIRIATCAHMRAVRIVKEGRKMVRSRRVKRR